MKTNTILATVTGLALTLLYARSVWAVTAQGFLASAGAFQVAMVLLQTSKLAVILSVRRLREGSMVMVFDIFSIELLVLPILVIVGQLTGDTSFAGFEVGLFSTWPLSLALVFVPFAIFRVVRAMLIDGLPSSVLPGAVLVTGLTVFSAEVVSRATGPAGTTDFTRALVGGVVSSAGAIFPLALDPVTVVTLPAVYLALLVYAAIGRTKSTENLKSALLIGLFSSVLVLGWTVALASTPGAVLIFALPTFGILAVVWWSGRGA